MSILHKGESRFKELEIALASLLEKLKPKEKKYVLARIIKLFMLLGLKEEAENLLYLFGENDAEKISEIILDEYMLRDPTTVIENILQYRDIYTPELFYFALSLLKYFEKIRNKNGYYIATSLIYECENFVDQNLKDRVLVNIARTFLKYKDYDSSITAAVGITENTKRFKMLIDILNILLMQTDDESYINDFYMSDLDNNVNDLILELLEEIKYCINSTRSEKQLSRIAWLTLSYYSRNSNRIYAEIIREIIKRASIKGYYSLKNRIENKYYGLL